MKKFQDKIAIVTGAGSGIGKALGERLARLGAIVVLSDINSENVTRVVEGIRAAGGRVERVPLLPDHSTTSLVERIRASTR